jgi:hypothetical protein
MSTASSTPSGAPALTPIPVAADALRAYVNERGVTVPPGACALDAVAAYDAAFGTEEAVAVREGRRRITDSRGLPCAPEAPLVSGSILRVVTARAPLAEADDAAPAGGAA